MAFLFEMKLLTIQPIMFSSSFSVPVNNLLLMEIPWDCVWNVTPWEIINHWLQTGEKEHFPLILLIFCLWFFVGFSIWHVAYITFSFFAPSHFVHPQFNSPHLKILFYPIVILYIVYLTHPVHKCFPKCVCLILDLQITQFFFQINKNICPN